MVDQLWMWVVNDDLIFTSFPQRWQQPRVDPHDLLDRIVNEINSPTRAPIEDVFELAIVIAGNCLGAYDARNTVAGETQFLDMFESSIGDAMEDETVLFEAFEKASKAASQWLRNTRGLPEVIDVRRNLAQSVHTSIDEDIANDQSSTNDSRSSPVQTLLDISSETLLLGDIKDIRDELEMLKMVFHQQKELYLELTKNILSLLDHWQTSESQQRRIEKAYDDQSRNITNPLRDIERMEEQVNRIYDSIRDLLDLKQKHANAMQAADTARAGQTLMVFTIVTVIFLPLSFLAAFFAINIKSFPHASDGSTEMSLGYVSKYVFGVGVVIASLCVILALTVEKLVSSVKRFSWVFWRRLSSEHGGDAEETHSTHKAAGFGLITRSSWHSGITTGSSIDDMHERKKTRFRVDSSLADIERAETQDEKRRFRGWLRPRFK